MAPQPAAVRRCFFGSVFGMVNESPPDRNVKPTPQGDRMDYDKKPETFEEAIDLLFHILDRETLDIFAGRTAEELKAYHATAGALIQNQFRLSGGNPPLLADCRKKSGKADLEPEQAAIFILEMFWARLQINRQ